MDLGGVRERNRGANPLQTCIIILFETGFCFVFFLRSPGCPGTHSVDQTGLELRDPPTSAS